MIVNFCLTKIERSERWLRKRLDLAQGREPWRVYIQKMEQQPPSDELPLCPSCARPIVLARAWPRVGGLAEMQTFECKRCSIVFTELANGEGSAPERVGALHDEIYNALH